MARFSSLSLSSARHFALLCSVSAALLLSACASDDTATEKLPPEKPAQELFDQGQAELEKGNYKAASKSFNEVERLHPYSDLAPQAMLLAAEALYQNEDYDEAVVAFEQFLQLHPSNEQAPRALYYKALCYYDQISDVTRDQDMTRQAMESLQMVVSRYPDSSYAREATLKLDLTNDHLAGKEMEIGRWYLRQDQLQAAIGRFRTVVDRYQTTSHVPEALHRLIESYLRLGLTQEARETAAVLGHNFPGSPWYIDTYRLLGEDPAALPEPEGKSWLGRTVGKIF
jgi:outer membrane protein assembly factor BamD